MISVYHSRTPSFFVKKDFKYSPSDFILVANVYGADSNAFGKGRDPLERAFQLTNTIDSNWYDNDKDVAFLGDSAEGCRSTSVGDVLHDTDSGKMWLVASCGFKEITSW